MSAKPRHGTAPPEPQIVRFASLEGARTEWTGLAERTANVFSTWDWAEIWWRHYGAGRTARLAAVKRDEEFSAILPLYEQRRRGIRVLRFLGHGVADQLGPVCSPDRMGLATEALGTMQANGAVLLAERLPSDRDWARELGGAVIKEEASPTIDLVAERDFESYLGARSANFRQQVRRRARKLQRSEGVSFRLCEDPERLQRDFDALLALHAERFGAASTAFAGTRERFHRDFAARALERGWLRLWFAEAGGTPVAAWYGFRFAGVESFYQSGRNPDWNRRQVGAGLLEHTIREAFADGMREYRLLRGDEQYKQRYATRDADICTVAAARRPLGRGIVVAVTQLMKLRRGRQLLRSVDH